MRRLIDEKFIRMQIWIDDRKIRPLDKQQRTRMREVFDTIAIPLHAVVSPANKPLARLSYDPLLTEEEYRAFLEKGLAAMKK